MINKKSIIIIVILLVCIGAGVVAFRYLKAEYESLSIGKIEGNSMEPTYASGNLLCYKKTFDEIKRQDIIIVGFRTLNPNDLNRTIKRIVATPGDRVDFGESTFSIPGEKDIPTLGSILLKSQLSSYNNIIPPNQFLLLGDNRDMSLDSRKFGLISRDQIIGKVIEDHILCPIKIKNDK